MNSLSRIAPKGKLLLNNFKYVSVNSVNMSGSTDLKFETLAVSTPKPYVYHVELNRPNKLNSLNEKMWKEIGQCFNQLSENPECRSIVLSGSGKLFCAGIDLNSMANIAPKLAELEDVARKAKLLRKMIQMYQDSLSSLEKCDKPVIAAVHSACVGAGVDMICGADIRLCTKDAWFQIKEVDIGMAADVGTLQRLPKIVGSESLVRDLCLTARRMPAVEAEKHGFVSKVLDNKESLLEEALNLADTIAKKSPVAVQVTKRALVYARDHSVQESLDQIGMWNQAMLQSEDFMKAVLAQLTKDEVTFAKL